MAYRLLDLAVAALAVSLIWVARRKRRHYPPGPKGWPILGNLFDIPRTSSHEKFWALSKEFESDIVYLDAAGTPFIILNSLEAASDLLEKRSAIYSSRPFATMSYDLLDGKRLFPLVPYGDKWREERRLMTRWLASADQALIHTRLRDTVQKALIPNLLQTPQDFISHIHSSVGGAIIPLTYGLQLRRVNDPWVRLSEAALQCLTDATVPGKYAVDVLPFLKYIPGWMPGAGFRRKGKEGRELVRQFVDLPFEAAKKNMSDGIAEPSFVTDMLGELGNDDGMQSQTDKIRNTAGSFFGGGADTSVCVVKNFIATMLLYPEVQARAQSEIDKVVGTTRFPDFHDKPDLPYLGAVLKEVLRWKPVVPTGLPHMSTEDDTYRGYFIPKGSIVVGNTWGIFRDEKYYSNPSEFDPDRFLDEKGNMRKGVLDPETVATFGFGRRSCPGVNVALPGIWLTAASLLACFDILPALDECGNEVEPMVEYTGETIVAQPAPFKCRFVPRSKEVIDLIHAEYDEKSEYIS